MAIGWRQPLTELDTGHDVVEAPFLRLAVADKDGRNDSQDDEHLGWNITDQTTIPPYGECRYLVELAFGQAVQIDLASSEPVEVLVCDDDDYDSVHDGEFCSDNCFGVTNMVSGKNYHRIAFRAASAGVYDVIVCNPDGKITDVIIQLIAAAVGVRPAKRPIRETTGRLPTPAQRRLYGPVDS